MDCGKEFLYHNEREIYEILVMKLSRDPIESMKLLALWLWLEEIGYGNVVHKIYSSSSTSYTIINEIADEGVTCLNCINTSMIHSSFEFNEDDIPQMCCLMDKEISLKMLYENKILAKKMVDMMLKNMCMVVLGDIMDKVNTKIIGDDEKYNNVNQISTIV
ncbi:uncharacterized protein LOC123892274 [Trifolium pratense]|uniref:uncharacterized protein LOC123892274 n=1 Tax=Trifolium pratense TaxID=57577 RepID=UPI001E6926AD|nr:uncharacterized protein LOC123892274 [Trifolium pratense]